MKYKVEIIETLQRTIDVEASSAKEAIEQVQDSYRNCEIVLSADDYIDTKIELNQD